MASRRVPLSTVPNAANSPVRAIAVAASKRSRPQAGTQEDNVYDGPPPAKKQIIELNFSQPRTPPPRKPLLPTESKVFSKRPIESQLTAFDRRLLAAKDRSVREQVEQTETAADEPYDTLRQWQKHYRKAFPSFVFYFESVNEEARRQYSKRLHAFGAVSLPMP
jgi:regulatory subunit for Cdc7p protein kinase